MSITVRYAHLDELDAINELRREVNELHVNGRPDIFRAGFSDELKNHLYDEYESDENDIVTALCDGRVCGFATVQYIDRPLSAYNRARKIYRVEEFGVAEEYRRRGVGTAIVDFLKKEAGQKGYAKVELDVWEFNEDALKFYEKTGFVTVRRYMEIKTWKDRMNIKLVKLTREYKPQLDDMMSEWLSVEQDFSPYAIRRLDYRDFDHYLENLERKEESDGLVPDSVFFCLDCDRNIFVGAVDVRHYLNENLSVTGGHIGDGVRPSERRKGYATAMIALALDECRKIGITRVLMTCDKDNIGSAKSIMNNGGVLENEVINEDGVPEQRYWIEL